MVKQENQFEGGGKDNEEQPYSSEILNIESELAENVDDTKDENRYLDDTSPIMPDFKIVDKAWRGISNPIPSENSSGVHDGVLRVIKFAGDDSNDYRVATNNLPPNR